MDQKPTKGPTAPKPRRKRPTWLRFVIRLGHLVWALLFMLTRFLETAIRDPLAWAILATIVLLRTVYWY